MKKLLHTTSRTIVGILFIFSGFVKAVDPTGYAIKIIDYLGAFHFDNLAFAAMPLAISIAALEFLTGIHLLMGFRIKASSTLALLFMIIFTPLTLGIAIFNPVTDCGCFGDAIKLSNWHTFFKNIILLIPTIYIFYRRKEFTSQLNNIKQILLTLGFTIAILGVAQISLNYLPIIDFRPYSVGVNIPQDMSIPIDAEQPEYQTSFTMEKNGEKKIFSAENYPYNDSTWVFISNETKVINTGYQAPIHDFVLLNDNNEDVAPQITTDKNATLLIVSSQIQKGVWGENIDKIRNLKKMLIEKGIKSFLVTSSSNENISSFEYNTDAGFDYLIGDETMLKTVIRSNPGLVLIQDGNIIGKWHYNNIPNIKEFENPVSFSLKQTTNQKNKLILALFSLTILLFSSALMITRK